MEFDYEKARQILHICYGGGGNHIRRVQKQFNIRPEALYIWLVHVHTTLQISFEPPSTSPHGYRQENHLNELTERLDKLETEQMIVDLCNRKVA